MKLYNFRDLGDLPTTCNQITKTGLLYRTGNTAHFTEKEARFLHDERGVKLYIDFRAPDEVKSFGRPEALINKKIEWLNISIDTKNTLFEGVSKPSAKNWTELYQVLLDRNIEQWTRFKNIIASTNEPILYGCLFGKDRTGIATSILLHELDVDLDTIATDYSKTENEIDPLYQQFKHLWKDIPITEEEVRIHFLNTPEEIIRDFIEHMREHPELSNEASLSVKDHLKKRLLKSID